MKRVKLFFVTAALSLITVGVFAGKSRFFSFIVYASNNGTTNFIQLNSASVAFSGLAETGTASKQATIASSNSNGAYGLYYSNVNGNTDFIETSGF